MEKISREKKEAEEKSEVERKDTEVLGVEMRKEERNDEE